jgi:integrase
MPRRQKEERRILGPYRDGDEWRIVVIDPGAPAESRRTSCTNASKKKLEDLAQDFRYRWSELDEVTVESSLAMYKTSRMAKGTSDESITETIRRIRLMFADGSRRIDSLDENYCTESYETLVAIGTMEVATHQNLLIQARSWLRWCKKKGWIRENPLDEVESLGGTPNKGKDQHTINEAKKLNAWLRWRALRLDHAAIGCLMLQGMALRSGDVCKRIVRDVDANGTVLLMSGGKTPKSNRPRHVPVFLQPLLREIVRGRDLTAALFPNDDGTHHTKSWLKAAMKRFCRDAGVRYVCPHSLKGTAATVAKIVGKTAEETMEFLSHEDVRTHQEHYEDTDAVLAAQAAKLDDIMTEGEA